MGRTAPAKGTEMRQLGSLGGRRLDSPTRGTKLSRQCPSAVISPRPPAHAAGPPAATAGRVRLLARALHLDHDAAHQRRSYVLQGMRRESGIPRHRTHRSVIALSSAYPAGRCRPDRGARSRWRSAGTGRSPNGGCAPERSRLVRRGRREPGQRRSQRAVCGYPARRPWHPAQAAKARSSTCFHSLSLLIHLLSIPETPNLWIMVGLDASPPSRRATATIRSRLAPPPRVSLPRR